MNQRAGLTTTPAPGDGAGLRLEINQQEIVGGWATGNGVIAWPESGKINRMHGDSRGQVKGVFGDCQFTCFPDCQLALSPDPAMNLFLFRALPAASLVLQPDLLDRLRLVVGVLRFGGPARVVHRIAVNDHAKGGTAAAGAAHGDFVGGHAGAPFDWR